MIYDRPVLYGTRASFSFPRASATAVGTTGKVVLVAEHRSISDCDRRPRFRYWQNDLPVFSVSVGFFLLASMPTGDTLVMPSYDRFFPVVHAEAPGAVRALFRPTSFVSGAWDSVATGAC